MRDFFDFWKRAITNTFNFGWVISGLVSAIIPDLLAVCSKVAFLANLDPVKWVTDHPLRTRLIAVGSAVLCYMAYAPYKLYKERHDKAESDLEDSKNVIAAALKELDERPLSEVQFKLELRKRYEDGRGIFNMLHANPPGFQEAEGLATEWTIQLKKFSVKYFSPAHSRILWPEGKELLPSEEAFAAFIPLYYADGIPIERYATRDGFSVVWIRLEKLLKSLP